MSFLLWFVAIISGLLALAVLVAFGQNPVAVGLFGLSLVTGVLGFIVDEVTS